MGKNLSAGKRPDRRPACHESSAGRPVGRWLVSVLAALTVPGAVAVPSVAAQGALLWQQTLNGASNGFDLARSVAVDRSGNVFVAGHSQNTGLDDFTVVKIDRDGTLLWQRVLDGTANPGADRAMSVAVDPWGNVVAAGWLNNAITSDDFAVVKFDTNGTLLWQRLIMGDIDGVDQALAVAVDRRGNVIAAGFTQNAGALDDFTVVKFDADGTLLWQQIVTGSVTGFDQARAVAVDPRGDVVAAGYTRNSAAASDVADFTVVKIDRNGPLLWMQTLAGSAGREDQAFSVAADILGNVVAGGHTMNAGSASDFTVAQFAGDGTLNWMQTINGSANGSDAVRALTVDSAGNVVAGGFTSNIGTANDFTVVKFDPNGALLWQQVLAGTAGQSELADSVVADLDGNVVAAGFTRNVGSIAEFTVVKFDPDGALVWQQLIDGSATISFDAAFDVAVDSRGNVIAAGFTDNVGTFLDFTVAKFAP